MQNGRSENSKETIWYTVIDLNSMICAYIKSLNAKRHLNSNKK
jgi:hypothetical protein